MRRKHVQYDDMPAAIPNNECDPVNEECNGGACVTSKTLVDKNETEFLVESLTVKKDDTLFPASSFVPSQGLARIAFLVPANLAFCSLSFGSDKSPAARLHR